MEPDRVDGHRLADEAGISLVEVLVTVVLLGIVMGAMARSLTVSLISAQGQESQVRATALLQESLEQVVGVRWDEAALCQSAADARFSGGSYTYPDGTVETLVVLDDDDETCTQAGGPPIVPFATVGRDGTSYDVETVVTWSDDPLDDESGSDPNSAQDVKHVQVTVTWEQRGEARSVVNETYRAPGGYEQRIQTQVDHAGTQTLTYLDWDPSTPQWTMTTTYLRLWTQTPQSGVTVSWVRADDTAVGPLAMSNVGSDGVTWQLEIPDGSPDQAINNLANGETIFTFASTDAATAEVTITFDRGLFVIQQPEHEVTSRTYPSEIVVDDGVTCDFSLGVVVRGALSSDLVDASWSAGPSPTALVSTASSSTGATFETSFDDATGFTAGTTTTLTVSVERIADGHIITESVDIPVRELGEDESC
jgi:type II secretory pathway pseudopilin PulG